MSRLVGASWSDVGRVRAINQDAALTAPELSVFAVADGMGGHRGGEVAAALAVEELAARLRAVERNGRIGGVDALVDGVLAANERVFAQSRAVSELQGMGTTLCALAMVGSAAPARIALANVGDSRVYVLSEGELSQLTEDHSLVQAMVRQGQLSPAEAAAHPLRNVVTRVIGVEPDVEVDWWERPAVVGERYLLCSDGLFNEVGEARIAATLRLLADPADAAHALVVLANDAGGRDNITCVVVDVIDDDELPALDPGPAAAAELAAVLAPPPEPAGPAARRLTSRVAVFVAGVVTVAVVAVVAVRIWAAHSYFVQAQGDNELIIYRGRPDGVWWFSPEPVERVELAGAGLTDAQAGELPYRTSSLDDALAWVDRLVAGSATAVSVVPSNTAPSPLAPSTVVAGPVPSPTTSAASSPVPAGASPASPASPANPATPPTTGA